VKNLVIEKQMTDTSLIKPLKDMLFRQSKGGFLF